MTQGLAPRIVRHTALLLAAAAGLAAQPAMIMPVREVKAGMKGIGKTVFTGDRVEEFQVEILGVLENAGPRQSIILGRLSGGPLEKTGVMQGMSGSPVYVGGRLIGAVALAFSFATDAIAGIRPIEEMLSSNREPVRAARTPARTEIALNGSGSKLIELATPVSFSGFTQSALMRFSPDLKAMGLEPMQGALGGGGGASSLKTGDPRQLRPG